MVVPGRDADWCFRWQGWVLSGWDRDHAASGRLAYGRRRGPVRAREAVTSADVPVPGRVGQTEVPETRTSRLAFPCHAGQDRASGGASVSRMDRARRKTDTLPVAGV